MKETFSDLEEVKKSFDNHPVIVKLRQEKERAARTMNFATAMAKQNEIDKRWKEFASGLEVKTKSILETISAMSDEDATLNYSRLYSLILMADIFDCFLSDLRSDLSKYDKGALFTQFDALHQLSVEASSQIKYALKHSENGFIERFADNSLGMMDYILNEVKEVMTFKNKEAQDGNQY